MKYCSLILASQGLLFLLGWGGVRIAPETAPAARGAEYAAAGSCIECHGKLEYPLLDAVDSKCSNANKAHGHPEYSVECGDVIAFFETVRLQRSFAERVRLHPDNPLLAGELLARKYHCFQCHGQLGQGGFKNAKALKGYVPGYFGRDFAALTNNADPESVRQWITHGVDSAIMDEPVTGPIASFFLRRQAVHMPAFKSLPADEIDILVSYVTTLHRYGPMTATAVRSYGDRTRIDE